MGEFGETYLVDFANGSSWQFIDHTELTRYFVRREIRTTVLGQLDNVQRGVAFGDDEGNARLAPTRMSGRDHRGVVNVDVRQDHLFDFCGVYVLASRDEHLFGAPADSVIPGVVALGDVARAKPFLIKRGRSGRGIIPVSRKDVRALNVNLATARADDERVREVVVQRDLHVRVRFSNGPEMCRGILGRQTENVR